MNSRSSGGECDFGLFSPLKKGGNAIWDNVNYTVDLGAHFEAQKAQIDDRKMGETPQLKPRSRRRRDVRGVVAKWLPFANIILNAHYSV